MKKLEFLKVLNSPFKIFSLKFYIGKIAIGTPYFYPRTWINNPEKPGYLKAVPKKIGFDLVGLGWKTKWDEYRFEWSPLLSFVFFKWQFAIIVKAPEADHYWEAWLYYYYETDKSLSKKERIKLCKENYSLTWNTSNGDKINYYNFILKDKYNNE